jgi:predicted Abi (CAAX) family protease
MTKTPPSRTERLVRALLLLVASALLTLLAWSFGLYQSENSTLVSLTILGIVIVAVLISRLGTKLVMRRFGG